MSACGQFFAIGTTWMKEMNQKLSLGYLNFPFWYSDIIRVFFFLNRIPLEKIFKSLFVYLFVPGLGCRPTCQAQHYSTWERQFCKLFAHSHMPAPHTTVTYSLSNSTRNGTSLILTYSVGCDCTKTWLPSTEQMVYKMNSKMISNTTILPIAYYFV